MFRLIAAFALIGLLLPAAARAQSDRWPDYRDLYVNDLAELIEPGAEDRIRTLLQALRVETGVEMTVLTIEARADYVEGETLEGFATTLFNRWGVGDAQRNDGILVLVARRDRAMRIALGSGYDSDWDRVAKEVIEENFLPYFRNDRYSEGIEEGTGATIARIARPHHAGLAAPVPEGSGLPGILLPLLFVAGIAALAFRRRLGDLAERLRRCPNCGHRGLRRARQVLTRPTRETEGQEESVTTCPNCDYTDRTTRTLPVRSRSSSGGSFGGGSSSGGGASGRW